ncbi:MAG: hypothetical protein GX617_09055 [Lentisphaerae bacterium]|nr:hypothetical protein [Lentisphaerota bacterium]
MATKNSPQSFMSFSTILLLLTGLVAIYDFAQIHVMVKRAESLRRDLGHFVAAQARLAISQQQLANISTADTAATAAAAMGICDALQDDIEQFRQDLSFLSDENTDMNLDLYARALAELRDPGTAPNPAPRQQRLTAVLAARNALHMDFTNGINAQEQQLKELNATMLKTITRAVWLVITCVSIGMVFAMKGHHRLQNILIRPISKMTLTLESIIKDEPQAHHLPIQHDPLLNDLTDRINNLIDKQQVELDKSRQQLHSLQQAALTLVNVLPRPAILFAGQHEIFVANKHAWDMIAGEGGKSLLAHMQEAIAKGEDHFQSHGLHFRLNTLNPANDDAPAWLKLVEIGPGEEAKDDTVNGDNAPSGDGAKAATGKNNGTATKPTLN